MLGACEWMCINYIHFQSTRQPNKWIPRRTHGTKKKKREKEWKILFRCNDEKWKMKITAKSCSFLRALLDASSILITDLARCRRCNTFAAFTHSSTPSNISFASTSNLYIMLIFRCICTCTRCSRVAAHVISAFGIAIPHHRAISVERLALRKHNIVQWIFFYHQIERRSDGKEDVFAKCRSSLIEDDLNRKEEKKIFKNK